MIRELYTEDLDINLKYNIYLHCVQNDDVILNINVYDKSLQADLSNYTCRLKAFKSDQIPLIQNTNIDVNGNVVKIEASKQLTTTAGIVKVELQFTDKSTLKKKSTFFIEIKVEKSSLNVDGAVSTPLCTLLEEIDNKLDQIENIGLVLDEAKQVRDTLESDIVVGNTTNENIVQSISDADSKKREVEISISNASDKISQVEDSITNADNSRNALDRSKEVADETKIDLDNANVQAEKNIEELNKLGDVTDLAAKVQTNTENISKNTKSIESLDAQMNEIEKPNLLINGEPLIWQRATELVNKQDFCADRWMYVCWASSSASGKIEKDFDGSMKMTNFNTTGNYIRQIIETSTSEKIANKKITLSADIKANNINTGNIYIQLVFSNGVDKIDYSGIVTHQELVIAPSDITSDYKRFKLTADVPDTTKTISVQIGSHSTLGVVNTDCILNVRNIKLEVGADATPFIPELYTDVLNQCLRYFQSIRFQWIAHDPTTLFCMNPNYYIPMRAIPTVGLNLANADHFGGGHVEITGSLSFQGTINSSIFYIVSSKSEFLTGEKYSIFANLDSEIR